MQVDIFSLIESLDCGMPYPQHIDLSLSIKTNKTRIYKFLWLHFYQTLDITTLVHFIFYAHIVDVPAHPAPFNVTL